MESLDRLNSFEQSVYDEYNRSGLTETGMGFALLLFALAMAVWPGFFLGQIAVLVVVCIPMYFLLRTLRWRLIYPRLGYTRIVDKPRQFRLSPTRRKLLLRWFLLSMLFALIFRFAWELPQHLNSAAPHVSRNEDAWTGYEENGQFTLLIVMGLAALRVYLKKKPWGTKSFWLIAILALGVVTLSSYFQVYPSWVLCLIGLPMTGIGLMRLRGFLRDHPKLESADGR
jgi:hypothetical protein